MTDVATEAPPPVRAYELPSARGVVAFGLTLAYRATSELRRASLYIGLLTLAILGPPLVFAVELIARYHLVDLDSLRRLESNPTGIALFGEMVVLVYAGLAGWVAVAIDGQLIAISLLAARAADRPYRLRDAETRARQVFWRLVRGAVISGLVAVVIQLIVLGILTRAGGSNGTNGFIAGFIATLAVAPLGYLATGIVLGDVGAAESLRRSIRLARTRPRVALVVALFTLVTSGIQSFALGTGTEVLFGVAGVAHIDPTAGVAPLVITILGILALVMAFGSLTFTIAAIVAAPQVAAFLGLTYYSAGLDRAFEERPGARKFRWVTRPMLLSILVVAALSGLGILSLPAR